jgi:hypothetical protein
MMACQEITKAQLECKEPTSENMEVPKELAAVKPARGLRKWHRVRKLAAECHSEPEERTQGNCDSQKELAAACRRITHFAVVEHRKARTWLDEELRKDGRLGGDIG